MHELLNNPKWPAAVPQELICNEQSENELQMRANAILWEIVATNLGGKRFLDFGCGLGHCVFAAQRLGATAFGYDIQSAPQWDDKFITNLDQLDEFAPFDVILLHDVIDHIPVDNLDDILQRLKKFKSKTGFLAVRCHPFSSRHAGHWYQKINKAFMQLVFTESELVDMGLTPMPKNILPTYYPIMAYDTLFSKYFKIKSKIVIREKVEPFFERPEIKNRIIDNWRSFDTTFFDKLPVFQMEQCFLDYKLT